MLAPEQRYALAIGAAPESSAYARGSAERLPTFAAAAIGAEGRSGCRSRPPRWRWSETVHNLHVALRHASPGRYYERQLIARLGRGPRARNKNLRLGAVPNLLRPRCVVPSRSGLPTLATTRPLPRRHALVQV